MPPNVPEFVKTGPGQDKDKTQTQTHPGKARRQNRKQTQLRRAVAIGSKPFFTSNVASLPLAAIASVKAGTSALQNNDFWCGLGSFGIV